MGCIAFDVVVNGTHGQMLAQTKHLILIRPSPMNCSPWCDYYCIPRKAGFRPLLASCASEPNCGWQ